MGVAHGGPVPAGPSGRSAANVPDRPLRARRRARARAGAGATGVGTADPRPGSLAAAGRRRTQRAAARPAPDQSHPEPPDLDRRARRSARRPRSRAVEFAARDLARARWGRQDDDRGRAREARDDACGDVRRVRPADRSGRVIPAIAAELGISAGDTPSAAIGLSTLDRVVDELFGAQHLLVLDNCEHVVGAAAKAVYELPRGVPRAGRAGNEPRGPRCAR